MEIKLKFREFMKIRETRLEFDLRNYCDEHESAFQGIKVLDPHLRKKLIFNTHANIVHQPSRRYIPIRLNRMVRDNS